MKNNTPNVTVKINYEDGHVGMYHKMSLRRFSALQTHRSMKKIYIKVRYGKGRNAFGKISDFTNSGTYDNFEDASYMLGAFLEK